MSINTGPFYIDNYDPTQFGLILDDDISLSFGDTGTFFKLKPAGGRLYGLKKGAQGEVVVVKRYDTTGDMTIKLQRSSTMDTYLWELFQTEQYTYLPDSGVFSLYYSTTLVAQGYYKIGVPADMDFVSTDRATENPVRTWDLVLPYLQIFSS